MSSRVTPNWEKGRLKPLNRQGTEAEGRTFNELKCSQDSLKFTGARKHCVRINVTSSIKRC